MNNSSIDNLISILTVALIILIVIATIIAMVYISIILKQKKDNIPNNNEDDKSKDKQEKNINKYISYDEKSVLDFMEFEKIEDNMIIRNNGTRFVMVVECKGINYDLISNDEKISVENSFIQYLNSLRYPIQLYVQTRKVNLEDNINRYNSKFKEIEKRYLKEKVDYEVIKRNESATNDEIRKKSLEYKKISNLYEYTNDIIQNTKNMSFNKNILSKKYYVVLSYSPDDEIIIGTYDKSEYHEKAFNELYTRAKSTIRILEGTGVKGRVLDSYELAELLYMAYNKEQAEVYGIDKIIKSRYTDLYITSQDILDKKEKILDEKIEKEALLMVDRAVNDLRSEKERKLIKKEANLEKIIKQMASEIVIGQNKNKIDEDTKELVDIIDKMIVNTDEEKEDKNDKEKETKRRETRTTSRTQRTKK